MSVEVVTRLQEKVVVKSRCLGCSSASDFSVHVDEDGALVIKVSACDVCTDVSYKEGVATGKELMTI